MLYCGEGIIQSPTIFDVSKFIVFSKGKIQKYHMDICMQRTSVGIRITFLMKYVIVY